MQMLLPMLFRRVSCLWEALRGVALLLCCSVGILTLAGCGSVPQVVDDEAVFGELDALYTAVTSKRTNLLNDCRTRFAKLHDDGRVSDAGYEKVSAIMELCEDNKWDTAAQRLHDFMRAQRKTTEN